MAKIKGCGTSFGFGVESTWGTPVARSVWLKAARWEVTRSIERELVGHLVHGDACDVRDDFDVREMAEGDVEAIMRYEHFGYLLDTAMGATAVTTGTGSPYTHTWELGTSFTGLTFEGIRGDSGKSEVFEGVVIPEWSLQVSVGDLMRFRARLLGQTATDRNTAGSPSFGTGEMVAHYHAGTLGFNSQTYKLTSMEVSVNNQLARIDELGSKQTAEPVLSNFREVRIRVELLPENENLYQAQIDGTQGDATITFTGSTSPNALAITLRNAKILSVSDPITEAGPVRQTVEFRGYADASDGSLSIAITNAQANYYD